MAAGFYYSDSLGYYITFSTDCHTIDTAYVRFINDTNIRQLRFEIMFKNSAYYGRKGLTNYNSEKGYFSKLERLSKNLNLNKIITLDELYLLTE